MTEQKTIVVIGNGLAGRSTAEALVRCKEVSVVVIESRTFYEEEYFITYAFGPGGADHYKAITHDAGAVAVPEARYVYGTVVSVSETASSPTRVTSAQLQPPSAARYLVKVSNGEAVEADAVVCATGYVSIWGSNP